MPNPDEDLELPEKPERRPSHFRKKRPDGTTKVIRVPPSSTHPEPDVSHVDKAALRQDPWNEVVNAAPALPDPVVKRPLPPPAPLPSQPYDDDLTAPRWADERARRKRLEDIVGTVGLAIMVAAMLAAIWLRMTGGTG